MSGTKRPHIWTCIKLLHTEIARRHAAAHAAVHPSVWSYFGGLGPDGYIGYLFVPLVLPFLGLWWLWSHRPARVASLDDVAAVS